MFVSIDPDNTIIENNIYYLEDIEDERQEICYLNKIDICDVDKCNGIICPGGSKHASTSRRRHHQSSGETPTTVQQTTDDTSPQQASDDASIQQAAHNGACPEPLPPSIDSVSEGHIFYLVYTVYRKDTHTFFEILVWEYR